MELGKVRSGKVRIMAEKKETKITRKEPTSYRLSFADRQEYIKDQKDAIVSKIGKAQALLLMQKTPRGEIRKRKLNPSNPKSPEFHYVEHAYVSEILNLAFVLDWDLVIDRTERVGEEVIVEGHLTVRAKGKAITKYGTGGAKKIANNPNQTWADVYNSATSKLLKVCAARLGLGLDLYRHEEATLEEDALLIAEKTIMKDAEKPATEEQKATIQSLDPEYSDEKLKELTKQQAADIIKELSTKT